MHHANVLMKEHTELELIILLFKHVLGHNAVHFHLLKCVLEHFKFQGT